LKIDISFVVPVTVRNGSISCFEKEHSSTNLKVTAGLPVVESFSGVASPESWGAIFHCRRATAFLFGAPFLKAQIS